MTNAATENQDANQDALPQKLHDVQEPSNSDSSYQPEQQSSGHLAIDTLPNDVKTALPEEAQHLYIAAYNSFFDNSKDPEAAARVAWQTIECNESYEQGDDGKWHRLPEQQAMHTNIHETSP